MGFLLPASLQHLGCSFLVQALVALGTLAIAPASSPVATADAASVAPGPTTLASR
jgi:hypothetical protein